MGLVDRKPTGVLRTLLRSPIWLYRAHLGWLAGHRLLYLAHRGRRTGARREVVVEVIGYDPAGPQVTVVAAWGGTPDWYRNLKAAPALEVRVGTHRWIEPGHRFPAGAETLRALHGYRRAHPMAWRRIAPLLGFPVEPDDPRWPEIAERVHAVTFTPRDLPVPDIRRFPTPPGLSGSVCLEAPITGSGGAPPRMFRRAAAVHRPRAACRGRGTRSRRPRRWSAGS